MHTNKNVFIVFFGLYFVFASFVNAQEKHQINISNLKCEKWLQTEDSAKIFFSAKNLMKVNYTQLMYQVVIKDNDGSILVKKYLDFGRLKPNGDAFATLETANGKCEDIASVQIVGAGMIYIDGENTPSKIQSLILDNTILKFDVKNLGVGSSESSKSADKSKDIAFVNVNVSSCKKIQGITTGLGELFSKKYNVSLSSVRFIRSEIGPDVYGLGVESCLVVIDSSVGVKQCQAICGVLEGNNNIVAHSCVGTGKEDGQFYVANSMSCR
jgi:hypothetical protein